MSARSSEKAPSMSAWEKRGLRCTNPAAYVRPKKPIEEFTAQEASDFLDWYAATTAEREARSNAFSVTAVLCLGAGLLAVPVASLISMMFR